jgi:hypothetical protein
MISDRCQNKLIDTDSFTDPGFFLTMIIGVAAVLWAAQPFGRYKPLFLRESSSGTSVLAYFLAKIIYDVLHLVRMTFIFISIYFLMSSPRGGLGLWFAIILALFWAAMGVAYVVSLVVPFHRATTIGVVVAVAFSVTSGLSPQLDVVRSWGPLQVFWYLSYNRWAAEAFTVLNVRGQPTGGRMENAITNVGYDASNVPLDIGITVLIGFAWRVLAFFLLRRCKPQTQSS